MVQTCSNLCESSRFSISDVKLYKKGRLGVLGGPKVAAILSPSNATVEHVLPQLAHVVRHAIPKLAHSIGHRSVGAMPHARDASQPEVSLYKNHLSYPNINLNKGNILISTKLGILNDLPLSENMFPTNFHGQNLWDFGSHRLEIMKILYFHVISFLFFLFFHFFFNFHFPSSFCLQFSALYFDLLPIHPLFQDIF